MFRIMALLFIGVMIYSFSMYPQVSKDAWRYHEQNQAAQARALEAQARASEAQSHANAIAYVARNNTITIIAVLASIVIMFWISRTRPPTDSVQRLSRDEMALLIETYHQTQLQPARPRYVVLEDNDI